MGPSGKRGFGGGSSLFGREGSDEISVDLNLTPLMDVMSNILFFLLAAFGAAVVSYIAVSVPVQSDGPGAEPKLDAVTVNLRVLPGEYRLSASNEKVEAAKLDAHRKALPKVDGAYDDGALSEALYRIKLDFPATDTLVIVPSETTVYEEIIRIMDAARERTVDGKKLRLMPKVVVADLVKAETAP
ncbi:Biopolymer transport protein ExbD/TolR [Vulgatibacter incomptus]|uniref:Biopolymer transport protein ExbD/TolR n=1 Tax=Vulgatibacter incomptus TaxID=1391653 RepID=A0A0K1PF02_9BACT|nr:Biopolymer transport protein ExbD/TolR [Vulgatibacter incomptus]